MKKEALLYERLSHHAVICQLCAHRCSIQEGNFGFCGVRQNLSGTLFTHAYGKLVAAHVDPVEKKPLYQFLPGSTCFSVATIGCNFRCSFCQNWEISQRNFRDEKILGGADISPEQIVDKAEAAGCRSIAYTYTEPTIFFEYALETAKLAKARGLRNIFVTNGYMTKEACMMIRPFLDAANIDLKFFRDESYREICHARLEPVKETISLMHKLGIWVEITTLVIPQVNDSPKELAAIAEFIASVDKNIPWHISRFHQDYQFKECLPTSEEVLLLAKEAGEKAGLKFIYVGNISGLGEDTICPRCREALIKRRGFELEKYELEGSKCKFCENLIPGVFSLSRANG